MNKFTIVTVCLNEVQNIGRTCESICSQTFGEYEWIVIDGQSTDGTLDVLSEYEHRISCLVSEPDSGIYDAMNKGIRLAKGEYLLFLNAGDYFSDNNALEAVSCAPDGDILYGDLLCVSENDESLIKLFESSLRFQNNLHVSYDEAIIPIKTNLEKLYLLDIACMATWGDKTIDKEEQQFLYQLGKDLKLEHRTVEESIQTVNTFYNIHKDNISLLSSKNIVKTFYDNSSKMVSKLISRNKKRLRKELRESKELMFLLSQYTIRDLSDEEQKKLQEQLLDVFKTIPSLAIFMLPGGALLLPFVVKFIPKLLPSAFDDNRVKD